MRYRRVASSWEIKPLIVKESSLGRNSEGIPPLFSQNISMRSMGRDPRVAANPNKKSFSAGYSAPTFCSNTSSK